MNIITALNNPNLNKKIKEKTKFNIIGNDIQYQEGILEMLNQNEEIDLTGTVKSHTEYNGVLQTQLSRCIIKKVGE